MDKTLFIVCKEGVYRHQIHGVYDSFEDASKRAEDLATKEKDDYHNFTVSTVELNKDIYDTDDLVSFSKNANENGCKAQALKKMKK